jgi:hypothetical protein
MYNSLKTVKTTNAGGVPHTEKKPVARVHEQRWSYLLHAGGILLFLSPLFMQRSWIDPYIYTGRWPVVTLYQFTPASHFVSDLCNNTTAGPVYRDQRLRDPTSLAADTCLHHHASCAHRLVLWDNAHQKRTNLSGP